MSISIALLTHLGIGPKVSQSVLTAAFLFAFKDVLYEQTIKLRKKIPAKAIA
jgi:adenine nucleotide transporter 17